MMQSGDKTRSMETAVANHLKKVGHAKHCEALIRYLKLVGLEPEKWLSIVQNMSEDEWTKLVQTLEEDAPLEPHLAQLDEEMGKAQRAIKRHLQKTGHAQHCEALIHHLKLVGVGVEQWLSTVQSLSEEEWETLVQTLVEETEGNVVLREDSAHELHQDLRKVRLELARFEASDGSPRVGLPPHEYKELAQLQERNRSVLYAPTNSFKETRRQCPPNQAQCTLMPHEFVIF